MRLTDLIVERAYAFQVGVPIARDKAGNWKTEYVNFTEYIVDLVQLLVYLAGLIAVLVIVWGIFLYTTSAGDDAKVKQAKDLIGGAIVGFILLVLIRILVPILGIQP